MESVFPWTQKQVDPIKNICFIIEKYIEDVKQDEKHVPDLVDNEAHLSCKRIVSANGFQNDLGYVNNPQNHGSNFLDSGNLMFCRIPEIRCFAAGGQCQPAG